MATEILGQPWTTTHARTPAGRPPARILAEEGVRETCERVADAWSRGDGAMLATVLAPDCDHVTLTRVRHVKVGRAALVDSWQEAFARRNPHFSVRMTVATRSVRLVSEDLALVDGALEYSEGLGAMDIACGRLSQPFTALMIRSDLRWLILALRVGPSIAAAKVIPCVE